MSRHFFAVWLCLLFASLATVSAHAAEALPPAARLKVDFTRDIQPILEKNCYECHSAKKQKSGLRLDDKENVLRGGDSGKPALVPGKKP